MADDSEAIEEHVVRLREDAAGWRKVNGPHLTPDDPFLTGLSEQEAEDLYLSNWAIQRATVEEARAFYGGSAPAEDDPLDPHPSDLTNDEVATLAGNTTDADRLRQVLAAERAAQDRKGATDALESRIEDLESDQGDAEAEDADTDDDDADEEE